MVDPEAYDSREDMCRVLAYSPLYNLVTYSTLLTQKLTKKKKNNSFNSNSLYYRMPNQLREVF